MTAGSNDTASNPTVSAHAVDAVVSWSRSETSTARRHLDGRVRRALEWLATARQGRAPNGAG